MSYARFGADGSDVYVFLSVGNAEHPGGWLECCSCRLQPELGVNRVAVRPTAGGLLEVLPGRPGPGDEVIEVPVREHVVCLTTAEMVRHLAEHRAAGQHVPEAAIRRLLDDADDTDAHIRGAADLPRSWSG